MKILILIASLLLFIGCSTNGLIKVENVSDYAASNISFVANTTVPFNEILPTNSETGTKEITTERYSVEYYVIKNGQSYFVSNSFIEVVADLNTFKITN